MANEGWTLDTLERYLSSKIQALSDHTAADSLASKDAIAAALAAVKDQSAAAVLSAAKAIDKAELATERRFEGVNEFRQTLSDQAKNFLNRDEWAANYRALEQKVDDLKSRIDAREGQSKGIGQGWGIIVGIIGIVYGVASTIAVISHFVK